VVKVKLKRITVNLSYYDIVGVDRCTEHFTRNEWSGAKLL